MEELDKLMKMLDERNIEYIRFDDFTYYGSHKVTVIDEDGSPLWDAICNRGSYGYEQGLLEIYGTIVNIEKDGDNVVGWLSAEEVIARLEST